MKNSMNFYEGNFEEKTHENNRKISFKKLENPGFFDNSSQFFEINSLSLQNFIYILGFNYKTSQGLSMNKNFFYYDISLNKWQNFIQIPQKIKEFFYFTADSKIFLLFFVKKNIKMAIFDIFKQLWEIKRINFSKSFDFEANFDDILCIEIKYPLILLFDMHKNEIYLIELEKCKILKKKSVVTEENKGKFNSFVGEGALIYKSFYQNAEKVTCFLSLWLNEKNEEFFMKKKFL